MGLARFLIRNLARSASRRALSSRGARNYSALDEIEDLADLYALSPQFDEKGWEEGYTEVIESMVEYAGNPGQETLLTDYFPGPAKRYCSEAEQDYDPEAFVDYVKFDLGDTYYNAISQIIDECSLILHEVWDQNYQNDNFLEVLFGGADRYTPGRTFSSMRQALDHYTYARAANGYRIADTAANRRYNSEKNRQALIKRFGSGPTKAWKGLTGIESTPGFNSYSTQMIANGYRSTNTAAGRMYNSEKNRLNLIKNFGVGKTKPWK